MKAVILYAMLYIAIFLSGCNQQKNDNHLENLPLKGFKYPIASLLKDRYPLEGFHYVITIYDEGEGGANYVIVKPSQQNEIGSKDAVDDANLFEMNGKFYQYAAFYDDWIIKESVEVIFDDNGILSKSIIIRYNQKGIPIEYVENKKES